MIDFIKFLVTSKSSWFFTSKYSAPPILDSSAPISTMITKPWIFYLISSPNSQKTKKSQCRRADPKLGSPVPTSRGAVTPGFFLLKKWLNGKPFSFSENWKRNIPIFLALQAQTSWWAQTKSDFQADKENIRQLLSQNQSGQQFFRKNIWVFCVLFVSFCCLFETEEPCLVQNLDLLS